MAEKWVFKDVLAGSIKGEHKTKKTNKKIKRTSKKESKFYLF